MKINILNTRHLTHATAQTKSGREEETGRKAFPPPTTNVEWQHVRKHICFQNETFYFITL
jgi:hypothetical protein